MTAQTRKEMAKLWKEGAPHLRNAQNNSVCEAYYQEFKKELEAKVKVEGEK